MLDVLQGVIGGMVNNPLLVGVIGLVGGALGAQVLLLIWNYGKFKTKGSVYAKDIGYKIGKFLNARIVKGIKDPKLEAEAIKSLDIFSDALNDGFDLGINGKKLI